MDFPTPLTNPPRNQKTDADYQLDIDVGLLILRSRYGATITIDPFEPPTVGQGHVRTLDDPPTHPGLTITLTAADGHTITRHSDATYPGVLWALQGLTHGEQLTVCGTPRPERIGQRFRSRAHTCGTAYPRRRMPYPGLDGVWRCEECDTKHRAHKNTIAEAANQRRSKTRNTPR